MVARASGAGGISFHAESRSRAGGSLCVHTEAAHQCVGANVKGQIVSLRHEISSGGVVEILTQKGHHPSRDWLSFVKSSSAKSKIRHWINEQEREEAREMGKRL